MGANSLPRRIVKGVLYPLLHDRTYRYVQGVAKAIDVRRGKWYEPEMDLIPYAVRPGDDVLDIGANYGVYTYHLSRAVGPSGHVFAFEPLPFTSDTLTLVVKLLRLRNVTVVTKGCSDSPGTVHFTLPLQSSGAPSAGQAHIAVRNDARPGAETQVRWTRTAQVTCEVIALDEFLPPLQHLSLVKCDIEGAELLAFRGATRLIETHHPSVICEIVPWFLDGFGLRLTDLVDFFTARGYGFFRYSAANRLEAMRSLDDVVEDNYVFIHADRLARFEPLLRAA